MRSELLDALILGSVPNWDGEGALPISMETSANAQFLFSLANALYHCEATIDPTSNGTISVQWDSDKFKGAIEIGKTRISGYGESHDGQQIFVDGYFRERGEAPQTREGK